ncbi:T9SS type A sorting domain-containing protein [Hymenobacter volaticus]|uniref:T9SS type A sorting domain-containing protein n=1 Tax=Hymenobacter volaticus TaxID=2932254 RepID=A0ABY4G541_9BACT|nr:T9SS type A sorting domain-containing protein [Hymenobacter volaticus]UOQ66012.1 T9SS type A sorting domain-containing protein [Hymenobacter volaticus]
MTWIFDQPIIGGVGPFVGRVAGVNVAIENAQSNIVVSGTGFYPAGPGRGFSNAPVEHYTSNGNFISSRGFQTPVSGYGQSDGSYTGLFSDADGGYTIGGFASTTNKIRFSQLMLAKIASYNPLSQRKATSQHPLHVFPNPAIDAHVELQLPTGFRDGEVLIEDMIGHLLWRQSVTNIRASTVAVPIGNLKAGVYLLRLVAGDGTVHQARLVRQ